MTTAPLRRARRGRAAARAAFSLLELVVVAALSSMFLIVVVNWIFTLNSASTVSLDNIAAARTADTLRTALADDTSAAVACAAGHLSPIASIYPDRVSFYVKLDPDPAAGPQLVTWASTPTGLVTRTVTAAAADPADPCAVDPATGSTQTLAENVAPVQADRILAGHPTLRPGVQAVADGARVGEPAEAWGACATGSTAARCRASALAVHWLLRSALDGAAPSTLSRTYPFSAASTGGLQ